MMKITNAEFIISYSLPGTYRSGQVPEFCVTGRSNVGKSSFINMLAGQNKLARTSSQPGRTKLINIFSFNGGSFRLADLPGYGYAKVSMQEKQNWAELIDDYFANAKNLKYVFALVDSRIEPTELDLQMVRYLYCKTVPFCIVATKADKLKPSEREKAISRLASCFKIGRDNIILTSSVEKTGRGSICDIISSVLNI